VRLSRTIFIGDVHACADELAALLEKVKPAPRDHVIFLGDLLDKGPKPAETLRLFADLPNKTLLLGNHEVYHWNWVCHGEAPKSSVALTRAMLSDSAYRHYLNLIAKAPIMHDGPDHIAVHASIDPSLKLSEQKATVLCGMDPFAKTDSRVPWHMLLNKKRPVLVGHRMYGNGAGPYVRKNHFYGLDSNCVGGGCLSAVSFPDRTVFSVRSKKNYWAELRSSSFIFPEIPLERPRNRSLSAHRMKIDRIDKAFGCPDRLLAISALLLGELLPDLPGWVARFPLTV
jgi:hypothetical protein